MLATVDPISDTGASWGAKGAAGDALSRAPHGAPFIAIWIDPEKGLRWSKANMDYQSLCQMAIFLTELAQGIARKTLE
jgi:hypothetical protein